MSEVLLLCATTRLAQARRGERPPGARVWPTPAALTLGQWLASLAEEAQLGGRLELPTPLDPFAESLLWERVIGESIDPATAPLFDLEGMAASAAEAHALAQVWRIDPAAPLVSDEVRLFAGWQAEFRRRCRAGGWLDAIGLQLRLIELIGEGHFILPGSVVLLGFDRLTPLETRLIEALERRGVTVECPAGGARPAVERALLPVADGDAECRIVAAWAKNELALRPNARLAIVAPDLAGVRDRLAARLDDALHPELLRPDAGEVPRCFNFSLGRPLAELPLVGVALDLLALGGGRAKVEQARLSALLLAGGWSAAVGEADDRARLDAAVRRDLPYFTSLPAVLRLAGRLAEKAPALCPRSVAALAALLETAGAAPRRQLPGQWAGLFRSCLKAAGWPGDRPLSSHEFQARRAFLEVLEGFGRFDGLLGQLPQSEALRRLAQLCRQRVFQPETRGQPAIQVLGVLESAGLEFDALWVMGMNDDRWPPPPRPNPLLPGEAQRAAGAAHASAEVELDFARRVHARLLRSAPRIAFSYAGSDGNRLLRPSPLLGELPPLDPAPPLAPGLQASEAALAGTACELIDDHRAPPVAAGEKVAGGSWLLRAQAICPAWAYYQYRLGGEAMDEAVEGLDPAARGTLVHGALEIFWRAVETSQELAALAPAARREAVAGAVAGAVQGFERDRRVSLAPRFRELETARLEKLLHLWLTVEERRGADFSVLACEAPAEVDIEGIKVRMVVDRIDRLADGRQIIIDYKTGAAIDIRNWAQARLTEPQLPIYAALVNDAVAAVVFAKVLPDKPAFAGVADEKDILPGVQGIGDDQQKIFDPVAFPDWVSVVTHWREALHGVAREVREGRAGVVFADEKALQYCEVLPLLRLPERRRLLALAAAGEAS